MKKLFTLLFVLSISLAARENPFEATNAYEEEAARLIEMNEPEVIDTAVESAQEQQYVNEVYEKMNKPEPEKPALTEAQVKEMIEKAKTKTIIKKEIIIKEPKEQVVYVKPRLDITTEKELLPFVKIEYDNEKLDIHTKYKVTKKMTLPGEKKMILDFNAKENFYTVRSDLNSTSFPKIAVGNHEKEKFFRIVVELAEKPENYEVTFNDKMVSIIKLYE